MTTAADQLAAICSDLTQIDDMARWAYIDGWTPTRPDPDAPAPPLRDLDDTTVDRDHVPGSKYDLGLGVHAARAAYIAAAHDLSLAHRWLIVAAHTAGARQVPATEPWPTRMTPPLGEFLTVTSAMRLIVQVTTVGTPVPLTRTTLTKARSFTDSAWHHLSALFLKGAADPDEHAVGEDPCKVCGIRPRAPKESKTGGRCHTCNDWFRRNKFERPTRLDPVHQARSAQARRRARGEGHGDESFSGARGA